MTMLSSSEFNLNVQSTIDHKKEMKEYHNEVDESSWELGKAQLMGLVAQNRYNLSQFA